MTDNRASALLPCPFCGGEDIHVGWTDFDSGVIFVECEICGMYCEPKDCYANEPKAIAAWNTRAQTVFGMTLDEVRQMMKRDEERERTCEVTYKRGAMYDVAHYSCCGYELATLVSENTPAENYCPNCGARVEQ